MSRSAFFPRRSTRDTNTSAEALLPQYEHPLRDLSPQPTISTSNSPPPSFYRDLNAARAASEAPEQAATNHNSVSSTRTYSTTGLSPERTRSAKGKDRRIQFAAPPPPIVQSVVWTGREKDGGKLSPSGVGNGKLKGSGGRSGMGSASSMTGSWIGSPGSRRASAVDPLVGLERRERALQKELQELLDAQSVGLVQGFGGGGAGDNGGSLNGGSDAGSSTPTSRSVLREGKRHVTPVRQPKKKTVGLRGARRGLLRDMVELVGIKNEEGTILEQEIIGREEVLQKVDALEGRIESCGQQLRGEANNGEESREIEELRAEERAVDVEIREMEDRLQQMRARKNWLGERISEGVNKREARLSSYRGALREAESEVKEFLRRPPLGISPIAGAEEEGFMALPPKRRTLGMAREFFSSELSSLKAHKTDIEKEKLALEDGAKLWQESVSLVMEFEDDLRTHMKSGDVRDADILKKQVEKMGVIISQLSNALKRAEEERWNLLICAIGAEVEAFKEGENILRGALGMEETNHIEIVVNGEETNGFDTNGLNEDGLSEEVPNELLTELRKIDSMESKEATDSEDDGPNLAELMVDQGAKEEQEKYRENSLLA